MICKHCGALIDDGSAYCANCGRPQNGDLAAEGTNTPDTSLGTNTGAGANTESGTETGVNTDTGSGAVNYDMPTVPPINQIPEIPTSGGAVRPEPQNGAAAPEQGYRPSVGAPVSPNASVPPIGGYNGYNTNGAPVPPQSGYGYYASVQPKKKNNTVLVVAVVAIVAAILVGAAGIFMVGRVARGIIGAIGGDGHTSYSYLSDEDVYYLDTDDWQNSRFDDDEKLDALDRLLEMIYDDGYTDVYDVYPNAQAAYDEIEDYMAKNPDRYRYLDLLLEEKLEPDHSDLSGGDGYDDVYYLDTNDWKNPDFGKAEKLEALDRMLEMIYDEGYTDVYDVYPDAQAAYDEIENYIAENPDRYHFLDLLLEDKLAVDYSVLSDSDVYYLDTEDWQNSNFGNAEKLEALDRLLKMIYDDGYTNVYDVYPNAQAAYDEIENYIAENPDGYRYLDFLLEDKLDTSR